MATIYSYNNQDYQSDYLVRQAIWDKEGKIFGTPETSGDWAKLGVTVTETIDTPFPGPREPDLDELKQMKLGLLEGAFIEYRNASDTFLISSLGFKVNANVTAFDNVSGLVAQLKFRIEKGEENPQVGFMTFDDELVQLNLAQMKTLQVEISQNGSIIYAQKWALREAIHAADDEEALEAIEIAFSHTDFGEGSSR